MTDFTSPEIGNKRLANTVFLQSSDMLFWNRLMLEIHQLTHPGESIPVPDPLEAGAWSRAYVLFEKLRDRAAVEEHRAVQHDPALENDQRQWNEYGENIEAVKEMLRRGILDRDTLVEHLDVRLPDDLESPTPAPLTVRPHENQCPTMQTLKNADCTCKGRIPEEHKPNGFGPDNRPLDWRARASRLSSALRWWGSMGQEARAAIKQQRALRQLQALKEARSYG